MPERNEVRVDCRPGGVAIVTLDRPEARNALGWQTWPELYKALETLAGDSTIRVLVLTGAGGCFSAGGDVKTIAPAGDGVLAPAARLKLAQRALLGLWRFPTPTVAAVEGFAVGAAWGLVLACDMAVAAHDAFFAAPFVQRGLVADCGVSWFLPRAVGRQRAAELILFGERLSAKEAADKGLVNQLVEPGGALPAALQLAERLADGPANALSLLRGMLRRSTGTTLEQSLDDEVVNVALNGHGRDPDEGRAAFMEKRPTNFRSAPTAV